MLCFKKIFSLCIVKKFVNHEIIIFLERLRRPFWRRCQRRTRATPSGWRRTCPSLSSPSPPRIRSIHKCTARCTSHVSRRPDNRSIKSSKIEARARRMHSDLCRNQIMKYSSFTKVLFKKTWLNGNQAKNKKNPGKGRERKSANCQCKLKSSAV